jgi:hypothetical protein
MFLILIFRFALVVDGVAVDKVTPVCGGFPEGLIMGNCKVFKHCFAAIWITINYNYNLNRGRRSNLESLANILPI